MNAQPRSYYGRPILKEPVWTWEIPIYFFTGGVAGASAGLAWLTGLQGNQELERRAWAVAITAGGVSPALLISDLGRPSRFLNMLRVAKPTSPMSMGTWFLQAFGIATAVATLHAWKGAFPGAARPAKAAAAILGLPVSTYTAALVANTSIPVWHEARRTLPFVFAAGAAASAGATAVAVTPSLHAAPARRLAIGGAAAELLTVTVMEKSLGDLAEPYHQKTAGRLGRVGKALTAAGGILMATRGGRDRRAALAGAGLIATGALAERWSVFRAGFQSAADPKHAVAPQRARVAAGDGRGAVAAA